MKKLLAVRKQKKSTEQGFSIAVSTGFGLIIMIIGLTLMGRAMKDSSVSASQKIISRSDAAAQVGTARYLAFIAKNPRLAGYEDCVVRLSTGVCEDTGTTRSWANASAIPGLTTAQVTEAQSYANANGVWQDIDSTKPEKGQFRVTGYTPNGSGKGTIETEGRVGQNGTGTTATNDIQTGTAEANSEIAYTLAVPGAPEKISNGTNSTDFPGIWLKEAPASTNQYFLAKGLLENSYTGTNKLYADLDASKAQGPNGTVAGNTPLRIEDFRPAKPTSFTTGTNGQTLSQKPTTGNGGNQKLTLPGASDTPTTRTINGVQTDVYEYYATNISTNMDINTVNSSGSGSNRPKKVIIYLEGNIDLSGSKEIRNICKDRQGNTAGSCDLSNLQIYGYATTANPNPKICMNGGNTIEAFIVAPSHTAGVAGGGNGQGVAGALWIKSWGDGGSSCNSNSNKALINQKGSAGDLGSYFPSTTGVTRTIIPATQEIAPAVSRKTASASSSSSTTSSPSPSPTSSPSPSPTSSPSPSPTSSPSPSPTSSPSPSPTSSPSPSPVASPSPSPVSTRVCLKMSKCGSRCIQYQ